MKWYEDAALVRELPLRYQAYAFYSRIVGEADSRRVPAGSFLLRAIRDASSITGTSTVARIRGIDGLTVVADFADERILEVIHEIRGENPEYRVLKSLLSAGGTFIDVGANFGTFSLLASRMVGANGRVIAIEPQTRLVAMIRESASLSGVNNCEVMQLALGNEQKTLDLIVPSDDSGRAGFYQGFSGRHKHNTERVNVVTLDSLDLGSVSLIKIDVEGSELSVIVGAADTIDRLHPPILIELNPWSARAANTSTDSIVEQLVSLGYNQFGLADSYPVTVDAGGIPRDRQINLIAQRVAKQQSSR
jgi:FkbM family methyltransferase